MHSRSGLIWPRRWSLLRNGLFSILKQIKMFDFYWLNASAYCDRKHCNGFHWLWIFLLAGVVILYRPVNKEGGAQISFAYVAICGRPKSGPVYCTEREQNSIYKIARTLSLTLSLSRIQAPSKTPINHFSSLHCEMNILLTSYAHLHFVVFD